MHIFSFKERNELEKIADTISWINAYWHFHCAWVLLSIAVISFVQNGNVIELFSLSIKCSKKKNSYNCRECDMNVGMWWENVLVYVTMTWRTTKLFTSKCSLRSVNVRWVTDHERRVWILPGRLKAPRFVLHSFSCHRTCEVINHISTLDFCLCHKKWSSQKVTTWHWEALAVVFQNPSFFPCHWFTNFKARDF